ncbi:MAG: hypothetical protein WCX61_02145 [Candidatus Peribacteraceae bacterium]|jgi:glucose-6-phosphate isomerase
MLHLDISATLAKAITPSLGIPEQEINALRTSLRRYTEDWLKERQNGKHLWAMDPYNKQTIDLVKETVDRVKTQNIRTVVWIGIGGSGLGPKVIQEVFEGPQTVEFILLDTIDPSMIELTMQLIDWKRALLVVASKSGGTLEPMSLFFFCWEKLKQARKDQAADYTIGITDPHAGVLRSFCLEHGIAMLPIPTEVGGRYSIFSPIGLLPLGLLDANIDAFMRGAKEMDTLCQQTSLDDNPASLLAAVQFLLDTKRDYPVRVIMPYIQQLTSLARWNQQLIAESLGKTETSNPLPLSAIGTQDQHSLLQQWMQGPRKYWHLFIRELEKPRVYVPEEVEGSFGYIAGKTFGQLLDACYEGTSQALTAAKRPHVTITLPRLDEENLGQLFFLLLAEVVLLGKLYRIDPYGQPGVELGKKITKKILSHGQEE